MKTIKASLRIFADEFGPEEISVAIGLKPTSQGRKGESRSKRLPELRFEQNFWKYASPLPDSSDLCEHLEHLLELMEARRDTINAIRPKITLMDIFCMYSSCNCQGSAELDANLLKRLAAQEIDLILDLYPPEGAEAGSGELE